MREMTRKEDDCRSWDYSSGAGGRSGYDCVLSSENACTVEGSMFASRLTFALMLAAAPLFAQQEERPKVP
jgi:hypothetical protein